MKYQKLTPVLMVNNVNETVAYYCERLGFELTLAVLQEGNDIITDPKDTRPKLFAMLKKDDVEIMFETQSGFMETFPDCKPNLNDNGVVLDTMGLYLEVDEVSQMTKNLEGKVNIIKPLHDTYYGKREVSIRDCNGYIITFAQNI
jgi:lactoylglutathione lyase